MSACKVCQQDFDKYDCKDCCFSLDNINKKCTFDDLFNQRQKDLEKILKNRQSKLFEIHRKKLQTIANIMFLEFRIEKEK